MVVRRCRYCKQVFQPSEYQPSQSVCGSPGCQRRHRTDYHRDRIESDPEYAESCLNSARKWRERHPGYWKQYRASHPASADRNREQQNARDRKQRLIRLANNNSASELKPCPATVWLLGAELSALANNNSAAAQVWVLQGLPPKVSAGAGSCKQQPSGIPAGVAG